MQVNRHGLSRDIPADVKREVRRRSGFGCVNCGCAIYQYEHVHPGFNDATRHDPERITLLCGGCHDRVTRGLLAKESISAAMAKPRCLSRGFSFGPFDVENQHPDVVLGPVVMRLTSVIIRAFGERVIAVDPPEESGGPFRLSAVLRDDQGAEVLSIAQNEWRTPVGNWDVEVVGQRITVRRGPGDITLQIRSVPPAVLAVERLNMVYRGLRIACSESQGFIVEAPSGAQFQAMSATAEGCEAGVDIDDKGMSIGCRCQRVFLGRATISGGRRL